jgi:transposase
MLKRSFEFLLTREPVVGQTQVRDLEKRRRELESLLGRKTLEVEILRVGAAERTHREAARPEKPISLLPS